MKFMQVSNFYTYCASSRYFVANLLLYRFTRSRVNSWPQKLRSSNSFDKYHVCLLISMHIQRLQYCCERAGNDKWGEQCCQHHEILPMKVSAIHYVMCRSHFQIKDLIMLPTYQYHELESTCVIQHCLLISGA